MLESFSRDVRFAARQLCKSPGFAATAILTLALGIGANTAMFSVVEGVLLSPLPYPEPDRLVMVWQSRPNAKQILISYPEFLDWRRGSHSFERMAAFTFHPFTLTGPGNAEHISGMRVSSGFFAALGVRLALGREFLPSALALNSMVFNTSRFVGDAAFFCGSHERRQGIVSHTAE